jgi:hypothetical protein
MPQQAGFARCCILWYCLRFSSKSEIPVRVFLHASLFENESLAANCVFLRNPSVEASLHRISHTTKEDWMKTSFLFVSILALVLTVPLLAGQQAAPQEQPQGQNAPNAQNQANPQDSSAMRTFEGDLSKIDTTAKTITVKATAPDRDMVFYYDDQTQVVGSSDGIQGLTGQTGSSLKISYREEKGTYHATKIEIQPKKA